MKRTNWLILLTLLACGSVGAQALTSIRIGTNPSGPIFYVDGTGYTTPQVFLWPTGSKHIVQFLFSTDVNNTPLPFQSAMLDNVHYSFGGWTDNAGLLSPGGNPIQTVTAGPNLTSLTGSVTVSYRVRIVFSNIGTNRNNPNCGGAPGDAPTDGPRYGVIYFDGTCIGDTYDAFQVAGPHRLNAFPYPGWVFYGFLVNTLPPDYLTTVNIVGPTTIYPLFSIAKRVNFTSNPLGLKILVDGALISTPPANTAAATGGCAADFTRLPSGAPPGFTPLCLGQFDFLPGSHHRIGSPVSQQDPAGNYWVFAGFSNGLKNNDVYTPDSNTGPPDNIVANFVPGVRVSIITNPGGLKMEVDGRTNWPGYSFIWGQGETHHLNAPLQQPDARNRSWKFMNWSNRGSASQDITVPTNTTDFAVAANYQVLGQLQVQSTPAGLTFNVDGATCTTPCTVDRDPGTQVGIVIPSTIPNTPSARYDFGSWIDGTSTASRQITFNQDVQIISASYHASYQVTTASDPGNAVTFKFDPPSTDGFYPEGTQLSVTATAKNGFRFRRWGGDLSGTFSSGTMLMSGPKSVIAMVDKVPFIAPAGIQNAASPTPDGNVAPGSIITIYGENLAPSLLVGPNNPLSQTLANVTVTVADRLLPLFFVSPAQINAQVPSDLPDGDYTLQVHSLGQADVLGQFTISRNAPGIFLQPNDQNLPLALALHEDGSVVTFDSPARRNEVISIYGTGFGPYDHRVIDGFPIASTDNLTVVDPVTVTTGEIDLHPDWTGAAKDMVGMTIVKLKIVDDMPSAANVDITVLVNGKTSNKVTLPVQ